MMKLLKPASVFLMLFAIVSLTSCLKNENIEASTRANIVTVQRGIMGETWLKNDSGDTFTVSANHSGKDYTLMERIIIVYRMINEDDLNSAKKPWEIELLSAAGITRPIETISRNAEIDSLKTKYADPILGFDRMIVNGDSVIAKEGYITAAINYRFSKDINKNKFVLFKYEEDSPAISVNGPDTINVYLGRNANGDANGQYRVNSLAANDLNYWPYYYFAFNMAKLIPVNYQKNELVMRIHYKKDKGELNENVINAVKTVKYTIK